MSNLVIPDPNIEPTITPVAQISPFKYWVQKVLPTVYDDSLSYYELLSKIVEQLNGLINSFDTLATDFDSLNTGFNDLETYVKNTKDTLVEKYNELNSYVDNYFTNLDVQEEINNKLDAMATDGTLTNLLSGIIDSQIPEIVSAWLDENVEPTTPLVDKTLKIADAAAESKTTGNYVLSTSEVNNMLDQSHFLKFTDWQYDSTLDEYYGPINGTVGTGKGVRLNWKPNTAYTVAIKAKMREGVTSSTGLRLNWYYTDGSYTRGAQFQNSDTTYKTDPLFLSSDPSKTVDFLTVSYATQPTNVWAISEMIITEGFWSHNYGEKMFIADDEAARIIGSGYTNFTCNDVVGVVSDFGEKTVSGSKYKSIEIPTTPSMKAIKIKTLAGAGTTVSFLTGSLSSVSSGATVPFSAYTNGRLVIGSNEIKMYKIPSDCTYIDIAYNRNDVRVDPPIIAIYDEGAIESKIINDENYEDKSAVVDYSYKWNRGGYIASGTSPISFTPTSNAYMAYAIIPCQSGDRFSLVCEGSANAKRWVFTNDDGVVLLKDIAWTTGQYKNVWFDLCEIEAPKGATKLVCNHNWHFDSENINDFGYTPKIFKMSPNNTVNYTAKTNGVLPWVEALSWKRNVVATYEKYVLINIGGVLYLSADCGETWSDGLDVTEEGKLINYHIYANGCVAFFSATKAFYTEDMTNYYQANVYETDGVTPYVPMETYNFNTTADIRTRKFIGSQDLYVFGNYILTRKSTYPSVRTLLWCSEDNGHSYRIVYEFGENGNYFIRHVHWVEYYAEADKFIICTGDRDVEDFVLGATYSASGEWTVEALGPNTGNRNYKWSSIAQWNGWLYYTHDVTPGAVKRCRYADIGDITKHETVLDSTPNDLTYVVIGATGDAVVCQSTSRSTGGQSDMATLTIYEEGRRIYYSSDLKNWSSMFVPIQRIDSYTLPWRLCANTYDNHIIIGTSSDTSEGEEIAGTTPSMYLDEIIRRNGNPQAFTTI